MSYNGHKNWNHWNVSLWINNDEGLYNMCRQHVRRSATKGKAAELILDDLRELGLTETPDGAPYTASSVRAALVGM